MGVELDPGAGDLIVRPRRGPDRVHPPPPPAELEADRQWRSVAFVGDEDDHGRTTAFPTAPSAGSFDHCGDARRKDCLQALITT